jgi:Ti-type conjugative transfer relaxase TraA
MAVYSCSVSIIGRASGRSAVAAAAYRAGEKLTDDRQQIMWDFTQKRGVLHSEIMLPDGAPEWARDREKLWNAAEKRDTGHAKQDSATIAREFRLALPHELDHAQRLGITRQFSRFLVERYGGAVDLAIHAPDRHGDDRNHHAHLMLTSRKLEAEGFTGKIRQLNLAAGGRLEMDAIRKTWADIQNAALERAGSAARVDHRSLDEQGIDQEPTVHVGVSATAMERKGEITERGDLNREITARNAYRDDLKRQAAEVSAQIIDLDAEREKRAEQRATRSEAKTLDPDRILAAITERRATFSRADLNRQLTEFLPDAKARSAFTDRVLGRADIIPLREDENAPVSRYTTRAVLDDERRILATAERMDGRARHGVSAGGLADALDHHGRLTDEQRAALAWATRANGLAIVAGEAGTGKSATLAAIRDAYEGDGFDVRALAWTNSVKEDLKADGFAKSSTIAAELMRQNAGRDPWTRRSVLIVDEAAMVSSKHLAALLTKADTAGAKVILAGDDQQLASIERGGMFGALRRDHGAAELHQVWRVKEDDQRAAFNAMHKRDFKSALETFDKRGAIAWSATPDESRAALVAKWAEDSARDPAKSRFVFAYTNAEVKDLNRDLRAIRKQRGELGDDHSLTTKEGPQPFAIGDRTQFTASAATKAQREAGLFNGAAGVVTSLRDDFLTVRLDGPKGAEPRSVTFKVGDNAEAGEFNAIRHGYAGTIYKGQGKTLDQTYVLHSDNWRAATGYVALSRHREDVRLFAAEKPAPWSMAEGGLEGLSEKQRASAERSFAAWAEAKPESAARYGFADYVGYVQNQWAGQKDMHRLDRMAQQMGRSEETRAASQFVQGAPAAPPTERQPPLSLVAGIVADYLNLCYEPARDWLRWVAEDLRHKAHERRAALFNHAGREHVHTEGARAPVAQADRLRGEPLPEVQGGLDKERKGRGGADGMPARPRTDPDRHDGLRSPRTEGAGVTRPPPRDDDDVTEHLRQKLARAADEATKRGDEPEKASDFLKERGRFRGRSRDR